MFTFVCCLIINYGKESEKILEWKFHYKIKVNSKWAIGICLKNLNNQKKIELTVGSLRFELIAFDNIKIIFSTFF